MRIHCLENVDKALQFLKEQRVHLENMGSHDIVDGNHRLTLGLIWTIILRFQVRELAWEFYLPPEYENPYEVGLPIPEGPGRPVWNGISVRCVWSCVQHPAALEAQPLHRLSDLLAPESLGSHGR